MAQDKNPSDTVGGVCTRVCVRLCVSRCGIFLIRQALRRFYASVGVVRTDRLCACLSPLHVERVLFIFSAPRSWSADLWLTYQVS